MTEDSAHPSRPATEDQGPFEDLDWPTRLRAHVVQPAEPRPRLHGYDVLGDLARHYGLADQVLLTLTGELPTEIEARALEVALMAWAPVPISEAPVHAAVITRISGAPTRGLLGLGAVGLAEQARDVVARHKRILRQVAEGSVPEIPSELAAHTKAEQAQISLFQQALPAPMETPWTGQNPRLETAVVLVLAACGLRQPWQMETALMLARLPALAAEAHAHRPGDIGSYPMNLPPFRYEEPADE